MFMSNLKRKKRAFDLISYLLGHLEKEKKTLFIFLFAYSLS